MTYGSVRHRFAAGQRRHQFCYRPVCFALACQATASPRSRTGPAGTCSAGGVSCSAFAQQEQAKTCANGAAQGPTPRLSSKLSFKGAVMDVLNALPAVMPLGEFSIRHLLAFARLPSRGDPSSTPALIWSRAAVMKYGRLRSTKLCSLALTKTVATLSSCAMSSA